MKFTDPLNVTIPTPRRLCIGVFYNSKSKEYCGVGYLLHHITGATAKEVSSEGEHFNESKLSKLFGEKYWELREHYVDANNDAPTQKARITSFKEFCGKLGIKLT